MKNLVDESQIICNFVLELDVENYTILKHIIKIAIIFRHHILKGLSYYIIWV